MIKYFIENERGEWLADPEYPGRTWTRNPYKAWGFETDDIDSPGRNPISMLIEWNGVVNVQGPSKAIKVWMYLRDEGCGIHKITEHKFNESEDLVTISHPIPEAAKSSCPGAKAYISMYRDGVSITDNSKLW